MLGAEVPGEVIAAATGLSLAVLGAAIGLFAWSLTKVVRLSELTAKLEHAVTTSTGLLAELFQRVHELESRERERAER